MDYNRAQGTLLKICKEGGSGDEKEVKKILDEHPSLINEGLNSLGYTILILASTWNHIEIIKLLILSYDNININKQDKYGYTVLHWASYKGHKDIVELLLLLSSNIDINIQSKSGMTALHKASYYGHKDIVELLLSHSNININIKDTLGKLASDICCDYNDENISNKPIILELFENHRNAKTALTLSTTEHSNEASSNNSVDQSHATDLKLFEAVEQKESHSQRESQP